MPADCLIRLREDAPLPWLAAASVEDAAATAYPLVPLALLADVLALNTPRSLGVVLAPGDSVDALLPVLDRIGLIELVFPAYRDGRPYSTARLLRDRHHYAGEIRATGDVLADQLSFMVRCGIDALALHPSVDPADAHTALTRWQAVYQPASDHRQTVWQQRHLP